MGDLRLFTVQQVQSPVPLANVSSKADYTWAVSSPAALQGSPSQVKILSPFAWFSAVCYFFGRETYKALGGSVPIGLVANPWGGTPVEAWSSPDALANCPSGGHTHGGAPHGDSVLYNAMVAPLLSMRLTGEVWYQGEDNAKYPEFYACRFRAMIQDYSNKFALPNMSFFFVELAAEWDNYAEIRRSQKHALNLDRVEFATAIDLGYNQPGRHCMGVHSPRKFEVGRRLSYAVQSVQYGLPVTYKGPTLEHVNVTASGSLVRARLIFSSAANLHVHGTASCGQRCQQQAKPQWQQPCCEESPFQVTYDTSTLRANYTLSSSGDVGIAELTADMGSIVSDVSAVYVSLQFEGFPQCALYNGWGGPADGTAVAASPFSTTPEPALPMPSPVPPAPLPTPPTPLPKPVPIPPAPAPQPCDPTAPDVSVPPGFKAMPHQGWWVNHTLASHGGDGTVQECAAFCKDYGSECIGFHVWKPCFLGDCYIYLTGLNSFSSHAGAYAYTRLRQFSV